MMKTGSALYSPGLAVLALLLSSVTASQASDLSIRKLHIRSDIAFRFATTHVTSQLANSGSNATEATFKVTLPKTAFISNFSMEIGDQTIYGEVKEKDAAKKQYDAAKAKGQSAGHVAATRRESNDFQVSVNVAANDKVTFDLWYQEVLQRHLGVYQHTINIDPGQVVPDLKIEVHINESRPITDLNVPPIRKEGDIQANLGKTNNNVVIRRLTNSSAIVMYEPTEAQQKSASTNGLAGQFIVNYDVERALDSGEIQVVNGYFVHVVAPVGLPPVPKNVLFILDTSGSMMGRKMAQMKEAMETILDDLRHEDKFNIITFSNDASLWMNKLLPVSLEYLNGAKRMVKGLIAQGGTAINEAFEKGLQFLDDKVSDEGDRPTIIIFLTDGMPTRGETREDRILSNVRAANNGSYVVFSLGFGDGVRFDFLKQLSLQNGGLARKIYEASDATLQLQDFYSSVSIPLLYNVSISYQGANVTQVTKSSFRTYFSGEEMIVAGRMEAPSGSPKVQPPVRCCIMGVSTGGNIQICPPGPWPPVGPIRPGPVPYVPWAPETGLASYIERMWAYLTIRELLEKELKETDGRRRGEFRRQALELSLQFNFVTPLTSMVVTLPENPDGNLGSLEDAAKNQGPDLNGGAQFRSARAPQFAPGPPPGARSARFMDPGAQMGPSGPAGPMARPSARILGGGAPGERGQWPLLTTTPAPPTTTAEPVLGHPSIVLHMRTGVVCFSWPEMKLSSHLLIQDGDIQIYGNHGRKGLMQSVIIRTPSGVHLVTPQMILYGNSRLSWGENTTIGDVVVMGSKLTFTLPTGIKVLLHRASSSMVALETKDTKNLPFGGMLKKAPIWELSTNDELIVPYFGIKYKYLTVDAKVAGIRCKAVQKDIFEVAAYPRRAK